MKKEKFTVSGMTCAACAGGIEHTLQKMQGVVSVSVSLMGESMQIEYDESVLSRREIFAAVRGLGYGIYEEGAAPVQREKREDRVLLVRFVLSAVVLLVLLYFSMGHMVGLPQPVFLVGAFVQWALATLITAVNFRFFTVGTRALVKRVPNMDTLVSLGSAVSYVYSAVLVVLYIVSPENGAPTLYFESAGMILTLVTLGKWLEALSKKRTGSEIEKLIRLAPSSATLVGEDGAQTVVPVSELQPGDVVLVRQGEYIPVDGEVVGGHAFVNKAAVTGESLPVEAQPGDKVTSANIVESGAVRVRAAEVGENTTLSRIIRMVREAGASKAPLQKIADQVAGVFVPAVTAIALITFIVWLGVGRDVAQAMNYAVSVLVISCPCSLGLATPVAVMAATGRGAGMGILYKDAEALQKAQEVNCVLLDKTATLTEGKPQVTDFVCLGDEAEVRAVAGGIESLSNHPLAVCVREFCGSTCRVESYRYVMGQGAVASYRGKTYRIGNKKLCGAAADDERGEAFLREGKTVVYLTEEDRLLALFAVADVLKESSISAVACLKERGIRVAMLTGDNDYVARAVARRAGIGEYYAEVLPEDKLSYVKKAQEMGGTVAMVGDGINDSPALKQADVGIAVGTGTDVAIDSADVVLAAGDLSALDHLFALSRKAVRTIKENLFWAFFYNCIAIPVAAGAFAWAGFSLNPMIAAACMSLSSLFVVCNALRITLFRKGRKDAGDAVAARSGDAEKTAENAAGRNTDKEEEKSMKITLHVEGMMCEHCAAHVTKALQGVAGVESVEVSLREKTAVVRASADTSSAALSAAVAEAGYTVSGID